MTSRSSDTARDVAGWQEEKSDYRTIYALYDDEGKRRFVIRRARKANKNGTKDWLAYEFSHGGTSRWFARGSLDKMKKLCQVTLKLKS